MAEVEISHHQIIYIHGTDAEKNSDLRPTVVGHDRRFKPKNHRDNGKQNPEIHRRAPWFVPNAIIRKDISLPTLKEETATHSVKYSESLPNHPNASAVAIRSELKDATKNATKVA